MLHNDDDDDDDDDDDLTTDIISNWLYINVVVTGASVSHFVNLLLLVWLIWIVFIDEPNEDIVPWLIGHMSLALWNASVRSLTAISSNQYSGEKMI